MSRMLRMMNVNGADKSAKKKIVRQEDEKIVDADTGELMHKRQLTVGFSEREPDYIKLYLNTILEVNGLPNGLQKVINVLLKRMSYDNLIVLNPYIKKQMQTELGYKNMQSLNNNLNRLVNEEIIFLKGTSTYLMNPYLFGRGYWEDIQKIRLELVFEDGAIKQKAHFEYNDTK